MYVYVPYGCVEIYSFGKTWINYGTNILTQILASTSTVVNVGRHTDFWILSGLQCLASGKSLLLKTKTDISANILQVMLARLTLTS